MFVFLTQILRLSRTPGYYAKADSRIQATFSQSIATRDLSQPLYAQDYGCFAELQRFFLSFFNRLKEMAKEREARLGERKGNQSWMAGCKRPEDAQNPAFLQLTAPFARSFGFLPCEWEELSLNDHLRIFFFLHFSNLHHFHTQNSRNRGCIVD